MASACLHVMLHSACGKQCMHAGARPWSDLGPCTHACAGHAVGLAAIAACSQADSCVRLCTVHCAPLIVHHSQEGCRSTGGRAWRRPRCFGHGHATCMHAQRAAACLHASARAHKPRRAPAQSVAWRGAPHALDSRAAACGDAMSGEGLAASGLACRRSLALAAARLRAGQGSAALRASGQERR